MPHAPIGVDSIGDRADRRHLHIDALITLRCTTISLPVAAADRQRVLAVSVLFCERVLAQLDGRRDDNLLQIVSACWAQCPTRRNKLAAHPPYQPLLHLSKFDRFPSQFGKDGPWGS